MFVSDRDRSTILLALFAVLCMLLAIAALNGLLDPLVDTLLG